MKYMWDERYASEEFVYGTEPNAYFKQEIDKLKPGRILLPAEGEGRNAVYAASLGWDVQAFDLSTEGKKKALRLAETKGVSITYDVTGFDEIELKNATFDLIMLCFAHVPPQKRKLYHQKMAQALTLGGTLLLEGFSKEQINNNSGGPNNIDMLFSKEELASDFAELASLNIELKKVHLEEGGFHSGISDVIRVIGKK